MDIQTAIVDRLNPLIIQQNITVSETAIRLGVPPSILKNILYGKSKNTGMVPLKKIPIQDFFADSIFNDLEQELD